MNINSKDLLKITSNSVIKLFLKTIKSLLLNYH